MTTADSSLRVMSFNIRYSTPGDRENQWPYRKDLLLDTIRRFEPHILGLQEALAAQADELSAALADYQMLGVGRDDGQRKGEFNSVVFRRGRFAVQDWGTFWLSLTPDAAGSKGWDANLPRVCTWARLHDRAADRTLVFANTHFDHAGAVAREQSSHLLRTRLKQVAGALPMILTGDFNCYEDDAPYGALVGAASDWPLADCYRDVHPLRSGDEASFHGFTGATAGSRIDWILRTRHWRTLDCRIDRYNQGGRYPSDHYPINATLAFDAGR